MDLTLDEHKLLAEFRRLSPSGKKELLDYAGFLAKKDGAVAEEENVAKNQCSIDKPKEARPEAVAEPIITE